MSTEEGYLVIGILVFGFLKGFYKVYNWTEDRDFRKAEEERLKEQQQRWEKEGKFFKQWWD